MMRPGEAESLRRDRDARLVGALRRGEPHAVEVLAQMYGPRIQRQALGILSNHADAEEVTQDVLFTVSGRIASFRERSAFGTWVYRITVNAALGRLRRRRRESECGGTPAPVALSTSLTAAEEKLTRLELGQLLDRAIGALSEAYRLPFLLRHVDGLSDVAIAKRLGLRLAATKSRVRRSRLLVRHRLAAYSAA